MPVSTYAGPAVLGPLLSLASAPRVLTLPLLLVPVTTHSLSPPSQHSHVWDFEDKHNSSGLCLLERGNLLGSRDLFLLL